MNEYERYVPASGERPESSLCREELLDRVFDDRGTLFCLLEVFREDCPGQIRMARRAIADNDAAALERVAHTLKGVFGNLSAPVALCFAGELEALGRAGQMAFAGKIVDQLEEELVRVVDCVESLCRETVGGPVFRRSNQQFCSQTI